MLDKLIRGKARELHSLLVGTAVAFAIYFALPWLRPALGC